MMDRSDEQKEKIKIDSQKYLDVARDEMETSTILLEHDKYQHSSTFLKQSLRNLIDCYFVIHDTPLTDEEEARITRFEELSKSQQLLKEQLADIPRKISEIDGSKFDERRVPKEYTYLSDEYQRIFYKLERRFKKLLKNDLATEEDKKSFAKIRKQRKSRVITVLFLLILSAGFLVFRYNTVEPIRIYYEQSQIFWTSSTESKFSEKNKIKFRSVANGQYEVYNLKLESPTKMNSLRLDPVPGKVSEVEIDYIELLDDQGRTLYKFDFNPDDPAWQAINIKNPPKPSDSRWRFDTTNVDPYIISPSIREQDVSEIEARFRIMDRLSFVNWILGRRRSAPRPEEP